MIIYDLFERSRLIFLGDQWFALKTMLHLHSQATEGCLNCPRS
ncbi:uncharacterized protein METZ01_LOCUS503050, partial [marine metagenome]